ncbi:MAG: Hint domain-containing protein [Pseudomonadota bacterium]
MPDFLANGLAISEILADNAGGTAIDTDGDGGINKADEYIEIQNGTANTVSLSGIQIWSQKNGLLFEFPTGATIGPGETATVLGEYTGPTPPGFFDSGGPANFNFLPDGEGSQWDSIFLLDTTTAPPSYVSLSYGTPPRAPNPPSGFPDNAVQLGAGESINSSAPNGIAFSRNASGDFEEGTPSPGVPDFICIGAGALIDTTEGLQLIETLTPGTRVLGRDGRAHTLVAVGWAHHGPATLAALPHIAPIAVETGSFGATRPLSLSPNHCLCVETPLSTLLFDGPVLVPAKALQSTGQARPAPFARGVTYFHLLFEEHVVLRASGVWVEALFTSGPARRWLEAQGHRGHLAEIAPGAAQEIRHHAKAFRSLRLFEARLLLKPTQPGTPAPIRAQH